MSQQILELLVSLLFTNYESFCLVQVKATKHYKIDSHNRDFDGLHTLLAVLHLVECCHCATPCLFKALIL